MLHCFSWRTQNETESNWMFRFYWKDHHTLSIFCRLLRWSAKCYSFFLQIYIHACVYQYMHMQRMYLHMWRLSLHWNSPTSGRGKRFDVTASVVALYSFSFHICVCFIFAVIFSLPLHLNLFWTFNFFSYICAIQIAKHNYSICLSIMACIKLDSQPISEFDYFDIWF